MRTSSTKLERARFRVESEAVRSWTERLPAGFRDEARAAIRMIELVVTDYTFEGRIEDEEAGLWFLQGRRVGDEQKTPHPFVSLGNYPTGVSIGFNIFTEAEGGLHAAVELINQPNIRGWKLYAGEDLKDIQDEPYLALRTAMYELRGSTVLPLDEARATIIMQAMLEFLEAP